MSVVFVGLGTTGLQVLARVKQALSSIGGQGTVGPCGLLGVGFHEQTGLDPAEQVRLSPVSRRWPRTPPGVDPTVDFRAEGEPGDPLYAGEAWLSAVTHEDVLVARLQNLRDNMRRPAAEIERFYLVASLAEASGAGLVLPLASLLRRLARSEDRKGLLSLVAVLLVPPGLDDVQHAQVAAALREVREPESSPWPEPSCQALLPDEDEGSFHPFTHGCYLVEAEEDGEPAATGEQLVRLVAEFLVYLAVPRVYAGLREARLDSPRLPLGPAAAFSCFAVADYVVPVVALTEFCARRLGAEMLRAVLLADSGEGALDDADAFVARYRLAAHGQKLGLLRASRVSVLWQPLAGQRQLRWQGVGSIRRAWDFRDRWERQDRPILGRELRLAAETEARTILGILDSELAAVLGRRPYGAFARGQAFLLELQGHVSQAKTENASEVARVTDAANCELTALAQERSARLAQESRLPGLRRWFLRAGLATATLTVGATLTRLPGLHRAAPVLGLLALAAAVFAAVAGWRYLMSLKLVKQHLRRLAGYLELARSLLLEQATGEFFACLAEGLGDRLRQLEGDRTETGALAAAVPLLTGEVVNAPDPVTGFPCLGFRRRVSLVTPDLIERLYLEGSGTAELGVNAALDSLASQFFPPPDGLPRWLALTHGDRQERLLGFCRQRFEQCAALSAETLLVQKALEDGERPSSATVPALQAEFRNGLFPRMQPASSLPGGAEEASLVLGLPHPGTSPLSQAVRGLHLERGLLHVIATGLGHRIVGLTICHGLPLESLRAWKRWQEAYERFGDKNLLHTRLAFSGRSEPTRVRPAGPPSPTGATTT